MVWGDNNAEIWLDELVNLSDWVGVLVLLLVFDYLPLFKLDGIDFG
jgi:hypothetical protein